MRDAYDLVFEQLQSAFDRAQRRYDLGSSFVVFQWDSKCGTFVHGELKTVLQSGVYKLLVPMKLFIKSTT